jgi:hypothetical protein
VSLILEALKKLDREKQAPERGLLVVGPAAWPSRRGGRATAAMSAVVGAVLAVAGMAAVLWLYGRRSPPAQVSSSTQASLPAPPAAPVMAPPTPTAERPTVAAGRAPARPPAPAATPARGAAAAVPEPQGVKAPKASPAADRFQLQAISARDGHPVAVLNDRLVREGDVFDGVRVVRIGADEVEIEVAGRRRLVKF